MSKGFKKFLIVASAVGAGVASYITWKKKREPQEENQSDGNTYDKDLFDKSGDVPSDRNYVSLSSDDKQKQEKAFIDDNPENDVNFDSLGSAQKADKIKKEQTDIPAKEQEKKED